LDFLCQKTGAQRRRQVIRFSKRRESGMGASKHEKGTVFYYTPANLTHISRSARDLHYEIAMAILHYFLPEDRVVVEKTAKIRDVR